MTLCPVWRNQPAHESGVFTIGLDPLEAAFVLERGWATLDGVRYRVSLDGCDGAVDGDGRIMVRCDAPEGPAVAPPDQLDRWGGLRKVVQLPRRRRVTRAAA